MNEILKDKFENIKRIIYNKLYVFVNYKNFIINIRSIYNLNLNCIISNYNNIEEFIKEDLYKMLNENNDIITSLLKEYYNVDDINDVLCINDYKDQNIKVQKLIDIYINNLNYILFIEEDI